MFRFDVLCCPIHRVSFVRLNHTTATCLCSCVCPHAGAWVDRCVLSVVVVHGNCDNQFPRIVIVPWLHLMLKHLSLSSLSEVGFAWIQNLISWHQDRSCLFFPRNNWPQARSAHSATWQGLGSDKAKRSRLSTLGLFYVLENCKGQFAKISLLCA